MRRILLCGIPGIGKDALADKIIEKLSQHNPAPNIKFTAFERELCARAWDDVPASHRKDKVKIRKVLKLPRNLFNKHYQNTWDAILKSEETEDFHIINCHLTLALRDQSEIVSLVSADTFNNHPLHQIIIAIDDIYDIHRQLSKTEYFRSTTGLSNEQYRNCISDYISELEEVLRWRSHESSIAYNLADTMTLPGNCMLIAAKHPPEVFADTILGEKETFYLSHPISDLRINGLHKSESNDFIKELQAVVKTLRQKYIVFEPTTIDELRFKPILVRMQQDSGSNPILVNLPVLTLRWGSTELDDCKYFSTSKEERNALEKYVMSRSNASVLELKDYLVNDFTNWTIHAKENAITHQRASILLGKQLQSLVDHISQQITSRDIRMAEQANHLFIFRPWYNGRESEGVNKEIESFYKIKGTSTKHCVFKYIPNRDLEDLIAKELIKFIKANSKYFYSKKQDSFCTINKALLLDLVVNGENLSEEEWIAKFEEVLSSAGSGHLSLGKPAMRGAGDHDRLISLRNEIFDKLKSFALFKGKICEKVISPEKPNDLESIMGINGIVDTVLSRKV